LQRLQQGTVDNSLLLKQRSTYGRADVDVLVEHLASVSDLSAEQICAIYEQDQEAIKQMIEADTGLPPTMPIDPKLHSKVAFLRFLKLLSGRCGSPLRNIRQKRGVAPSLSLDWNECGAYEFGLSEDGSLIEKISFRNGDVGDLTGEVINVASWKVRWNYSTWRAAFTNPPMRDKPLHLFFQAAKNGPYKYDAQCTKNGKVYKALIDEVTSALIADQQRVHAAQNTVVASKVDEVASKKRSAAMESARGAAKTKAMKKAQQELIVLGKGSAIG
jgi:hypothetical protein